ncbi:phosphotransferase [Streptomyces sp. NPDC054804]
MVAQESSSFARLRAVEASGDPAAIEGPLRGYHHETYVFPSPLPSGGARWKVREPRADILWFDRRCFVSEEQLLEALQGKIDRIPSVVDAGGLLLQTFIEGQTLGSYRRVSVPDSAFRQLVDLFRQMVVITPDMVTAERRCDVDDRPQEGDSNGFLEQLVRFSEERVYRSNSATFGELFHEFGIGEDSFRYLRKNVSGLTERPFCLLHADLHRENLIVDEQEMLWAIDWELAMLGDPLYDLATHVHLMRYPAYQEERMVREWVTTVEYVRPATSRGWETDLLRMIDFKRAQSVFTDVIRLALSLKAGPEALSRALPRAARKIRRQLGAAAVPLGLDSVPSISDTMAALARWYHAHVGFGPLCEA